MKVFHIAAWAVLIGLASGAQAAGRAENRFGSIYVDGNKAGQVHYTVEYGEDGDIETLKTRASLSILGIKLFNFEQNLHEEWRAGNLRHMRSRTDDDGRIYGASLDRGPEVYKGVLNDKPVELPGKAFPASVWHYAIVRQSLLFDLMALKLMNVKIARSDETITIEKKTFPVERFDFSGDWQATVWFDRKQQLVKFEYLVDGHKVAVQLHE
jgi:hypothetical protein